jgi:hypothetical protein
MSAQGIMLLIWTSKVPSSNSGWNTGYPDLIFSWLSSVPLGKCEFNAAQY